MKSSSKWSLLRRQNGPFLSGLRHTFRFATEADRVRQMFVEIVARNRRVGAQTIYDTEAACYRGSKAVPLLADRVGNFNDALGLALSVEPSDELGMVKACLRALAGPNAPRRAV